MNTETTFTQEQQNTDVEEQTVDRAAIEVADFLTAFALDSKQRERLVCDKEAFLNESDLSEEAKEILREPNVNMLLRKLNEASASLLAVIVLETVTTDVIVL